MLRAPGRAKRAKYPWIIGISVLPLALGSCAVLAMQTSLPAHPTAGSLVCPARGAA